MTFFELVHQISDALKSCVPDNVKFAVDLPSAGSGDLFSNITKVCKMPVFPEKLPFAESFTVDGGFLNIKLEERVFWDFLCSFEIENYESMNETEKRLDAYIQLAENEKKLAGVESVSMSLTSDVRRAILCTMKAVSFSETDIIKAQISMNEAIRILDKIRSSCENLKEFVITYEPLLISVRGSLSKLR